MHDRIRAHMAALGFPVPDMTDEELEQAVAEAGRRVSNIGVTASEAASNLEAFGRAFPTTEEAMQRMARDSAPYSA